MTRFDARARRGAHPKSRGHWEACQRNGHTSFQTNDVNADPNGTLQGTWTRQQVVHCDGSQ